MKKLLVILPAFNEAQVIGQVLDKLKQEIKNWPNIESEILVVNDASWDQTVQTCQRKKVKVLTHMINRGLGASLKTGIEYGRRKKADFLVTLDSDGQHDPKDLKKVIKPLLDQKADVVIGTRDRKQMPWDRNIITLFSSLLTYFLFGLYSSDTQSGFRAFNKKALNQIEIRTQRMEVSSEFFAEIKKHRLRLKETPVKVIYTDYSRAKGQSNLNSIKVLLKLILRLRR